MITILELFFLQHFELMTDAYKHVSKLDNFCKDKFQNSIKHHSLKLLSVPKSNDWFI